MLPGVLMVRLPIDPLDSANQIEMAVPAQEGEGMLAAKGGNPNVVGWNWSSGPFKFGSKGRVADGCVFI